MPPCSSISFRLLLASAKLLASVSAFAPIRQGLVSVQSHTRLAHFSNEPMRPKQTLTPLARPIIFSTRNDVPTRTATMLGPSLIALGILPLKTVNIKVPQFWSKSLERLAIACKRQDDPSRPADCLNSTLSNFDVFGAERRRIENGGAVDAHPVSFLTLYKVGCLFLDNIFDDRPIQRSWLLEMIARIPEFSDIAIVDVYRNSQGPQSRGME